MEGRAVRDAKRFGSGRLRSLEPISAIAVFALATIVSAPQSALADEGGVSFWLLGFFGSLAAAPQQPGWSLTSIYYHTSVSAGDVARAREFDIGRIPVNLTVNVSASLQAKADLGLADAPSPRPCLGVSLRWVPLESMEASTRPWRAQ